MAPYPLRVYRVPFSTNVERVALAAAHKGLDVEWVDVPYDDRTEVLRVSGQELVPVLVDGDLVLTDSPRILEHLEERFPEPPLFPANDFYPVTGMKTKPRGVFYPRGGGAQRREGGRGAVLPAP